MKEKIKNTDLGLWQAFLSVAEFGNFSKASSATGVTISQLSKQIAKLEESLGVRLFQRSTRVVGMTNEAIELRPKIESILQDLKSAEILFDDNKEVFGSIKISCVPYVAHSLLIPVLKEFRSAHPNIYLDLTLTKKFVDIIDEGFDMAIRIESPKDTSLIYRKLAANDLVLCASPDYLKSKPELTNPEDLRNHDVLMMAIHGKCKFRGRTDSLGKYVSSDRMKSDNGVFLTQLALANLGILVRAKFAVQEHLDSGELVSALPGYELEKFGDLHAVIPSKRFLTARVRLFLDFLVARSTEWS